MPSIGGTIIFLSKLLQVSGITKQNTKFLFFIPERSVTLQAVSKMEAKGVLYQLIRLRLYPQNLIRVMPTQG